jgi:transcriptional regulator with XRE-family HTH domain
MNVDALAIRAVRRQLRVTQEELAFRAGLSVRMVKKFEKANAARPVGAAAANKLRALVECLALNPPPLKHVDPQPRFWDKVRKTDGCWFWTAGLDRDGYGSFELSGRKGAHVVSWIFATGSDPRPMHVLHKCDNPSCVRPDHLFLGTNKDNMIDKTAKGRQARGVRNAGAKLTDEQVLEIRQRCAARAASARKIGECFGVSGTLVRKIASGRLWKHLPSEGT